MRMRRLPWAEEYLNQSEIVIKDPAKMKGRWRQLVKGEKLHLEIGCGKGRLLEPDGAERGPGRLDRRRDATSASPASPCGSSTRCTTILNRMRFIWGDAEKVDEWFGEG